MTERFGKERRWDVYGELRESGESMRRRIGGVIDMLVPKHKGERIALVTHGPMVNAAVGLVTKSPIRLKRLDQPHRRDDCPSG